MTKRLIRVDQLTSTSKRPGKMPFSRASVYRWCSKGEFPKPIKLGTSSYWDLDEVEAFLEKKAAERPNA